MRIFNQFINNIEVKYLQVGCGISNTHFI